MSDLLKPLARRALTSQDPALVQLAFDVSVLARYRESGAHAVIRTETVGRVRKQGGWSLDFGIMPGEQAVHASWEALANALPPEEREHWAAHAVPLVAASEMFLRMQLSPGSCFDDGELRDW
jgi:hypothetical protein